MVSVLIYVAIFEPVTLDSQYNTKRYVLKQTISFIHLFHIFSLSGLVACIVVFILLCVTVTPDGPFKRLCEIQIFVW